MDTCARTTPARFSLRTAGAIAALVTAAIPAAAPLARAGPLPFTVVETGERYASLQQAVDAIGGGEGTIAIASGTYRECAVQEGGSVAYLAAEPGKAALVLRGRAAKVSGLVFRDMAVPDYNGAGIRLEQGDLTVAQSWFADSQQGILTAADPSGSIAIDKSTFSGLGTCEGSGGCAHSIYIGDYGQLRVTRSRFERGAGGHYVKARAARVEIADSSFDDSAGHGTNYMIDLPEGAIGRIAGNWFVQGRDKENYSAFIALGAEEISHSSDGLRIAGNDARFVPGLSRSSAFVADWTGADIAIGDNNLAAGIARYEKR